MTHESGPLPAPELFTERLQLAAAGGRDYLLDVRVDPITRAVLSYRLRRDVSEPAVERLPA